MSDAVIRWAAWYGDHDLTLEMPAGWTVIPCPPHDGPDIGTAGIAASFANPIGTPTLGQLATGRVAPCVVIDDLSRPTPGDRLIPPILAELAGAGIPAEDVLILAGTANHRTLTAEDLRKKLGDAVLSTCRIAMHFSWNGCELIGETSRGTPVEINSDFLRSDLRILVGSIIPHGATGFSGGAKLLMPGVASIRSATAFHEGSARRGVYADPQTEARLECEEAARMAGVDFIVNGVPNSQRGLAAVVCGDLVAAHRAGAARAAEVFATPTPVGCDIAVFSLYPKDTEFLQHITALAPWKTAPAPIVREGGTIVIAAASTEGLGFHSLFGPGMHLAAPRATRVRDRELVFFAPGMTPGCLSPGTAEGTTMFATWEQTRGWLEAKHGPSARVAVFPCATIQLASPLPRDGADALI
jgi:nickel-dependent lactate racemase